MSKKEESVESKVEEHEHEPKEKCDSGDDSHEKHIKLQHCHAHCHAHGKKVTARLLTMIWLNGIFFFAELITGLITKSLSLQSDAFHMFSDEASLVIGLVAHKISKRKPTNTMTFGFSRAEVLGGLCNAVFMLANCITLVLEAIERILHPEPIQEPKAFIIVGVLGLIVNVLGIFIFHDHSHSANLTGVFLHLVGDFFGSVAVVISAAVVRFTEWEYKDYLDPFLSLLIVSILIYGSFNLFMESAAVVLERCPEDIKIEEVKESLKKIDDVSDVEKVHIWEVSDKNYIAIVHLVIKARESYDKIFEETQKTMKSYKVQSTTIQIQFAKESKEDFEMCEEEK